MAIPFEYSMCVPAWWTSPGIGCTGAVRWPLASTGSVIISENRALLTLQPRWPNGLLAPKRNSPPPPSLLPLLSAFPLPPLSSSAQLIQAGKYFFFKAYFREYLKPLFWSQLICWLEHRRWKDALNVASPFLLAVLRQLGNGEIGSEAFIFSCSFSVICCFSFKVDFQAERNFPVGVDAEFCLHFYLRSWQ